MGIHTRSNGDRYVRRRLTRPSLFLLGLLACLLFIPAATANANVMAKHRAKYKNKLYSGATYSAGGIAVRVNTTVLIGTVLSSTPWEAYNRVALGWAD
jgi:hypothetical protein